MSRKVSVHLTADVAAEVERRVIPSRGISATTATIVERYLVICLTGLPALSRQEWDVLEAVYRELPHPETVAISFFWAHVVKANSDLGAKLHLMPLAQVIAIIDFLEMSAD